MLTQSSSGFICSYGLLGPSGCGKTTLLKCIVGTLKISRGHITVLGKPPAFPGHEVPGKMVGYMPQVNDTQDWKKFLKTLLRFRAAAVVLERRGDIPHGCLSVEGFRHLRGNLVLECFFQPLLWGVNPLVLSDRRGPLHTRLVCQR